MPAGAGEPKSKLAEAEADVISSSVLWPAFARARELYNPCLSTYRSPSSLLRAPLVISGIGLDKRKYALA